MKPLRFSFRTLALCGFLSCLSMQIFLWNILHSTAPKFEITPFPPSKTEIEALSLGDKQFYYRKLAFDLQMAGNKLGHISSLRDYNYSRLYYWFTALSDMDDRSIVVESVAANYYSSTNKPEQLRYVVKFLMEQGNKDVTKNWRALLYASNIAFYHIKDVDLALDAIKPVSEANDPNHKIPLWAKFLGVFYLQKIKEEDIAHSKYFKTKKAGGKIMPKGCAAFKFLMSLDEATFISLENELKKSKDDMFKAIIINRILEVKNSIKDPRMCL